MINFYEKLKEYCYVGIKVIPWEAQKNNIYEENNVPSGEKSKNHLPWNQAINEIKEFFVVYSNNKDLFQNLPKICLRMK